MIFEAPFKLSTLNTSSYGPKKTSAGIGWINCVFFLRSHSFNNSVKDSLLFLFSRVGRKPCSTQNFILFKMFLFLTIAGIHPKKSKDFWWRFSIIHFVHYLYINSLALKVLITQKKLTLKTNDFHINYLPQKQLTACI